MSKRLFWFFSWTWGFLMTFAGFITFAVLRLFGYKAEKNQYGYNIEIRHSWGGFSMGPYCLTNHNPSEHLLSHEFGHSLQNCYFGPFMIFITFASIVRYWWREYQVVIKKKLYSELPGYDDIWFEGTATYLGNFYKSKYNS